MGRRRENLIDRWNHLKRSALATPKRCWLANQTTEYADCADKNHVPTAEVALSDSSRRGYDGTCSTDYLVALQREPVASMHPPIIRLAAETDLPAINAIYNHYVPISTTTYDVDPMTAEARQRWFAGRESIHPVTIACLDDAPSNEIVGWGSLHTFRNKPGYRLTVENSVYVHPDHQRQGVGSALLLDQIARARALSLHAIVAAIDAEQAASLTLHYKHGFREVGRFPQCGHKFDRWLDAVFMQLILE